MATGFPHGQTLMPERLAEELALVVAHPVCELLEAQQPRVADHRALLRGLLGALELQRRTRDGNARGGGGGLV